MWTVSMIVTYLDSELLDVDGVRDGVMYGMWKVEVKEFTMSADSTDFWPSIANTPCDICLQTEAKQSNTNIMNEQLIVCLYIDARYGGA